MTDSLYHETDEPQWTGRQRLAFLIGLRAILWAAILVPWWV